MDYENYQGSWRLMRRSLPACKVSWVQDRLHRKDAVAMWEAETKRHEENSCVEFWIEPDVADLNFD